MHYILSINPDKSMPKEAEIRRGTEVISVPLVPLPKPFWEWQLKFRRANLHFFLTGQGEHDFGVHVGYMATLNHGETLPINIAAKGVGLLPQERLQELTAEIESLIEKGIIKGEQETRRERLLFLLKFYNETKFDPWSLTTIEIYGKTTWRNIQHDPRCSILFSSYQNTSFLIHGVTEILKPETPEFRFVTALHDLFHLPKTGKRREYIAVYRIFCAAVYNKTPGPQAGERLS